MILLRFAFICLDFEPNLAVANQQETRKRQMQFPKGCNMKNAGPSLAKASRTKSGKNVLAKGLLREVWRGKETAACVARICLKCNCLLF